MNVGAALFLDIWEAISESLPNSKREDMARKLVHIFADKGMEKGDFEALHGEDDHLDTAIDAHYTGETADDDYDYDFDYAELEDDQ